MRIGSAIGRRLASAVVPLAFAAALPLVQWCPLGAAITIRDCLPDAPAAAAPTACGAEHADCPMQAGALGHCPLQHSTPTRCVGAPLGGLGLRPHSPELQPPAVVPALTDASLTEVETPRELGRIASAAEARPPTRSWAGRPPVRGPPLG